MPVDSHTEALVLEADHFKTYRVLMASPHQLAGNFLAAKYLGKAMKHDQANRGVPAEARTYSRSLWLWQLKRAEFARSDLGRHL
jgi:hypothetical protein